MTQYISICTDTNWDKTFMKEHLLLPWTIHSAIFFCNLFYFKAVLTHWVGTTTHYWVAAHIFKHWPKWSLALQFYDSLSSWKLPPALAFPPASIPLVFIFSFAQHKIVTVCMFFIHLSVFLAPQREGNHFSSRNPRFNDATD